jgi:hypothetical protein
MKQYYLIMLFGRIVVLLAMSSALSLITTIMLAYGLLVAS